MAQIFGSKEVYKRVPGMQSSSNPLRAVRGLYISGTYRPIYWIDAGIHISSIQSQKGTIVDLTTKYMKLPDTMMNISSIDMSTPISVAYYTVNRESLSDTMMNISSIDMNEAIGINYYTSSNSIYRDSMITITSISMNENIGITNYTNEHNKQIDFAIHFSNISSVSATIENATS